MSCRRSLNMQQNNFKQFYVEYAYEYVLQNEGHSVGHTCASRKGKNDNFGVLEYVDTNCKIINKEYVGIKRQ
jgi:hypothetical protein